MFRKITLVLVTALLASCGSMALAQPADLVIEGSNQLSFIQQDIPHTNITMLVPEGWVSEYYQGTTTFASDGKNLFYAPSDEFEGVLIDLFVTDAPRAVGPSFDVMEIAIDFVSDQPNVTQTPNLIERDGRQMVTTLYMGRDAKGKLITYLVGFVVEDQQLTVFLGATPNETELIYLPILTKMLYSIEIRSAL